MSLSTHRGLPPRADRLVGLLADYYLSMRHDGDDDVDDASRRVSAGDSGTSTCVLVPSRINAVMHRRTVAPGSSGLHRVDRDLHDGSG